MKRKTIDFLKSLLYGYRLYLTVLFFFMIVTHMRKVTLKVKYREPQGVELTRLAKKSAVTYIYIGKSLQGSGRSGKTVIQMNDKIVTPAEIVDYLSEARSKMTPDEQQQMMVSIKADRDTRMEVINEVKQALRQAKALKISYSATQKK